MWDKRHLIAHEARSEYFSDDEKSYPFQILMAPLERIAESVSVFAADNIGTIGTVADLWASVDIYQAPDTIKEERPHEIRRYGGINLLTKVGTISGIGQWFDPVFAVTLTPKESP